MKSGQVAMQMVVRRIVVLGLLVAAVPAAGQVRGSADATLARDAERFIALRSEFDQRALAAMMAPEYREVSPVGDVDARDAVIGFYAPEKKTPAPPMSVDQTIARVEGGVGTVTLRITYSMPGKDGPIQARALRAGLVARKIGGAWRFTFAQLTPIRG